MFFIKNIITIHFPGLLVDPVKSALNIIERKIYRNNLKNRELGKKAPQNSHTERVTIAERQGTSEHANFEEKPTLPKTDSSGCSGINNLLEKICGKNMKKETTTQMKARKFAKLHIEKTPFILANAWDAASARVFEKKGFSAIGTTSAGIAASRGYHDGQNIPLAEMLACVKEIISAVDVPVSVDIEAGFGKTTDEIIDTIKNVASLGAVGINIEDSTQNGLIDLSTQAKKIQEIRKAFPSHLWINARIDVFYLGQLGKEEALKETIRRTRAYVDAGADSIFVFAINDKESIATLAREIKAPMNVLAGPKMPSIQELRELGVARVSLGSGPIRATLGLLEEISTELLSSGTYGSLTKNAVSYPALQTLFK